MKPAVPVTRTFIAFPVMFCNIAFYVPRQPRGSRARALRWTAACFGTRRRLEAAGLSEFLCVRRFLDLSLSAARG